MNEMRTKREMESEWCGLLDISSFRPRTNAEELRLTELTAALYPRLESDSATLTTRLAQLEAEIETAPQDAAMEMMGEIIAIRNTLQRDGWADEQADGRMMLKGGHL